MRLGLIALWSSCGCDKRFQSFTCSLALALSGPVRLALIFLIILRGLFLSHRRAVSNAWQTESQLLASPLPLSRTLSRHAARVLNSPVQWFRCISMWPFDPLTARPGCDLRQPLGLLIACQVSLPIVSVSQAHCKSYQITQKPPGA